MDVLIVVEAKKCNFRRTFIWRRFKIRLAMVALGKAFKARLCWMIWALDSHLASQSSLLARIDFASFGFSFTKKSLFLANH